MTKYVNLTAGRSGQQQAIGCIVDRVSRGEKYTACVLPTRYGKSDVMRISAYELKALGVVSTALILVPNEFLRGQMVDAKKLDPMISRYDLSVPPRAFEVSSANIDFYFANCDLIDFCTATIQYLSSSDSKSTNLSKFIKWIKSMIAQGSKPPVIYIDESQCTSNDNTWGDIVKQLVDAGAYAVLLTATPSRTDGKEIPGFETVVVREEENRVSVRRPNKDDTVTIKLMENRYQVSKLIAHHVTSFGDAWREGGVLCRVGIETFDATVEMEDGNVCKLSDLTAEKDIRRALQQVVRKQEAIAHGVEQMHYLLDWLRSETGKRCTAIIFCGNKLPNQLEDDMDIDADQHAKEIKRTIQTNYPKLKPVIVTSANGEDAKRQLERFGEGNEYDVLIVKQMASVGLDIDHLKVCLDLSSIRSPAAWLQRIMRTATIYGDIEQCYYISPDDALTAALWQRLIADENGELVRTLVDQRIISEETVNTTTTEEKKATIEVLNIIEGRIVDTDNNMSHGDDRAYMDYARLNAPWLIKNHSQAEIIKTIKALVPAETINVAFQKAPAVHATVLSDELNKLHREIEWLVKDVTGKYTKGAAGNDVFRKAQLEVRKATNQAIGLAPYTKKKTITNLEKLQEMRDYLQDWKNGLAA